ncbi:ABC transporter substrate-binding protein [Actinospica robiniae]|uniref:ABC transporter substrate-binding protein n=1 Tax=Actinospica robiniae TaxID=304901 RepID=UPI000406FF41|nr:ABC transporter substrate-binding protein [Actinospica robiniae]
MLAVPSAAAGCSGGSGNTVTVVIGYQPNTIDTVNAGTLLRSLGYFEQQLHQLGRTTGKKYTVDWEAYDTGAPITTQMIAGKIDIGSMGDYPLLINGAKAQTGASTATTMIATTGYNLRGSLNMIVVKPGSSVQSVAQLAGRNVSTSVGSAADGTLVQALRQAGLDPANAVHVVNQQPSVGSSALQAGSVAALSQFIAWPGQLVFSGQAQVLYDGGALNVPTLHGVVVRNAFAKSHSDIVEAFLRAEIQATQYIWNHPLQAAQSVASATGLAPEVVYLYNGPDGIATFDPTLKPQLTSAMRQDVPFLSSIGVLNSINLNSFIDSSYVQKAYGTGYAAQLSSTTNPSTITGTDSACGIPVTDQATAGEVWLQGEDSTHPAATPTCLLRFIRTAQAEGQKVRAAYVPDAQIGTRWFAEDDIWVLDPSAAANDRYLPFTTRSAAASYVSAHPGTSIVSYTDAVALA